MRKIVIFMSLVAAVCVCHTAEGQNWQDDRMNGRQFYAELGGPGVLFSMNFDSRFVAGEALGFGYRLGIGFNFGDVAMKRTDSAGNPYTEYDTRSYMTFPVGINYVFGKNNSSHAFEVGAGVTLLSRKADIYNYDGNHKDGNVIGNFAFMYRFKPVGGGVTWRIGFTPIIGTAGDIMPSGAVGIGYAF